MLELSHEALVDDALLCERENSNLRRHLLWAAQYLPQERVAELAERIRNPIAEGGVVADQSEDDAVEQRDLWKQIEVLCDQAEIVLEGRTWKPLSVANAIAFLRDRSPKQFGPSLAFIRELADKFRVRLPTQE